MKTQKQQKWGGENKEEQEYRSVKDSMVGRGLAFGKMEEKIEDEETLEEERNDVN